MLGRDDLHHRKPDRLQAEEEQKPEKVEFMWDDYHRQQLEEAEAEAEDDEDWDDDWDEDDEEGVEFILQTLILTSLDQKGPHLMRPFCFNCSGTNLYTSGFQSGPVGCGDCADQLAPRRSREILHEGHLLSAGGSDEACEVINPWSDPVFAETLPSTPA